MEIWKDVDGFEGYYQVSNLGRVKSLGRQKSEGLGNYARPPKIMKPSTADRYAIVTFSVKGKTFYNHVHRLVAKAFIPNTENKPYINHINGVTTDNTVENLEWSTNSENQIHAVYVLKNGIAKPVVALDKKTKVLKLEFPSITKASIWLLETGKTKDKTCLTGIIKSCKNKIPSYMGYVWQYVEPTSRDYLEKE